MNREQRRKAKKNIRVLTSEGNTKRYKNDRTQKRSILRKEQELKILQYYYSKINSVK